MLNRNSRGWVAGASAIALGAMLALPTSASAADMLPDVTNSPSLTAQDKDGKTEVTLKVLGGDTSCTGLHVFSGTILPADINAARVNNNIDSLTKEHTLLYPGDPKATPIVVVTDKAYDAMENRPAHYKKSPFMEKLPQVEGPHTAYAVCKSPEGELLHVRYFSGTGAVGSADLLKQLANVWELGSQNGLVTGSLGVS